MKENLVALYSGRGNELKTDILYNKLIISFKNYLKTMNINLSTDLDNSLGKLADNCVQIYKNNVEFPFSNFVGSSVKSIKRFLPVGVAIATACILLFVYFLTRVYRPRIRSLRYISYGLSGGSLMNLLISSFLLILRPYEKINIASLAYHRAVTQIIYNSLVVILIISFIILVCGVVTAFYYENLKRKIIVYDKKAIDTKQSEQAQ
jgi:hypothetical protein